VVLGRVEPVPRQLLCEEAAYADAAAVQPAVATFFTEVFVMADDAALRNARLGLMKRLESLILQLGDISEIVAPES